MAAADYAWTADDLTAIKCAIQQLTAGKRIIVDQLTERTLQYQAVPLKELQALYAEIEGSLVVPGTTQATRKPTAYRSTFRHGY